MRARTYLAALAITTFSGLVLADQVAPPYPRTPSGIQIEELEGKLPGAGAETLKPRSIVQVGLDFIKVFEGWSSDPYDDPSHYCTIGYGHLIKKAKCADTDLDIDPIFKTYPKSFSREDGNSVLAIDTRKARLAIQHNVKVDLNDRQFAALTSFVFNVGGKNFIDSTLLKLLNNSDFAAAKKEFPKWIRSEGVKLPGLEIRRHCEVALFDGQTLARKADGIINVTACGAAVGAAPSSSETIDIVTGQIYK